MNKSPNHPERKLKRTWKTNIWGNTVGYEGGRRVEEFGDQPWSEAWAKEWCNGLTRKDAEQEALLKR